MHGSVEKNQPADSLNQELKELTSKLKEFKEAYFVAGRACRMALSSLGSVAPEHQKTLIDTAFAQMPAMLSLDRNYFAQDVRLEEAAAKNRLPDYERILITYEVKFKSAESACELALRMANTKERPSTIKTFLKGNIDLHDAFKHANLL